MCGISGQLHFDPEYRVKESSLRSMTDKIIHRGPDDEGFYVNKNVGFGFRRLSIIDLHRGHQPLCNEDGSVWIVFNGEIYNYLELRKELISKGHVFKTNSDTETIVHLYEEYGSDCVKHLRGMFAFAIWDDHKKKIFCARDHFGIKPFYYHLSGQRFIFGSEIKAVLAAENVPRELDSRALDSFFTYLYVTDDLSIYRSVKKLRPSHTLEIGLIKGVPEIKFTRYWDIRFDPDESRSEGEWCEELDDLLSESVQMQMISDVPLGAFLSGGIDSSSVVALMSRHTDNPIKTFSIGFKEAAFNELEYARAVARKYGTEHHEQIVEPESIELLPRLIGAYDEPFADSSAIPTYYVSKFARQHVTVALSGDGGDELFAGYDTYPKLSNIYKYNFLPGKVNRRLWGLVHKCIPARVTGHGLSYLLSKDRRLAGAYLSAWNQLERKQLYKPDIWRQVSENPAEKFKETIIRQSASGDFLSRMQELDMRTFMVDDVLTKVDRASMMNSLEVRVPLLDHKLAELSFRIPSRLKYKDGELKYILKKTLEKSLPASVLTHKKQGFSMPLGLWFKGSLKEYVNDRLSSTGSRLAGHVNMDYVRKVVHDHETGMRSSHQKIWALLVLDAWLEQNRTSSLN
ncbi:asparagine synthase [Sulfuricaulis limicola]|uniref:asparagine synthase (glutamine-hydrolyzing) n=1 Tax=Sulfuricaulis limicola TaxID=1620215 RepID=A0A1B4XGI0_9GAMM|nr:asparagine synthase (glutamine-hydrolyzing) [Sulfuricaulis limicola]BAV33911.1 asparagine synthase [Sulfuricaulis limicola]